MPNQVTYPVRILREHVTALEGALSVCLADPNLRAVHRLRTGTRRLEAQLLLLDLITDAPAHRDLSAALRRELRRLRRAAGEVRDLDVHREHLNLLETPPRTAINTAPAPPGRTIPPGLATPPEPAAPNAAGTQALHGVQDPHNTRDLHSSQELQSTQELHSTQDSQATAVHQGSARLAERLARKRTRAALELQKLLTHRQAKAAFAAEALLKSLRSAGNLKLSAADLIHATETVLYRDDLLHGARTGKLDEEELHAVRKSAKLARYLAETMPANPAVKTAAARFEALQEAGGLWHDALEMARAARRYLGPQHPLTSVFIAERRLHLAAYRRGLQAFPGQPSAPRSTSAEPTRPASAEQTRSAAKSAPAPRRAAVKPS